jgi:hypothetical protein
MPDWTDVQGLRPLMRQQEARCVALKAETADLRARLETLEARLTALETPGPPPVPPKPPGK